MKLHKGDIIETKLFLVSVSKNLWHNSIGKICRPVKANDKYVWIIPYENGLLRILALEGHPIGIPKTDIVKVNGKRVVYE